MKEETIKIIEESRANVRHAGTDFQFTILSRSRRDSLEILKWQKNYNLTDSELVTPLMKDLVERMREDAAVEVFRKFYQDTYLKI